MLQMGDAGHRNFEGHGDLLLHFFRGAAGPLRDDLDVVVRDVGVSLDGQVMKRDDAPGEKNDGKDEDHQPVVQRKIDKTTDHLLVHRVL